MEMIRQHPVRTIDLLMFQYEFLCHFLVIGNDLYDIRSFRGGGKVKTQIRFFPADLV